MYAVYGLTQEKDDIEVFIGYVPASFFSAFTEPDKWEVKSMTLPDGEKKIGRLFGRAFFLHTQNLRASKDMIAEYMGEEACPLLIEEADTGA